jgi:hypothetical protein
MTRLRKHLTFSNIVAVMALFIALGGASYAAVKLPAKSVGTVQLKNGAVTMKKLDPGARAAVRHGHGHGHGGHGSGDHGDHPGPSGETSATGANDGYFDSDSLTVSESQAGTTVSSTQLASGSYLIAAHLHVTGGIYSPTRCTLKGPSGQTLDYAGIEITPNYMGGGNELTLSAPLTLATAGQISVFCTFPDANDTGLQVTFVTNVSAAQVDALHTAE